MIESIPRDVAAYRSRLAESCSKERLLHHGQRIQPGLASELRSGAAKFLFGLAESLQPHEPARISYFYAEKSPLTGLGK